jgi:hypothetical protein
VITDLIPHDLTPAERLRGAAATIREHLAKLTAQSGLIGAKAPDFQFLVAVATDKGMGVLLALPGDDFLADIETVSAPADVVTQWTESNPISPAFVSGWGVESDAPTPVDTGSSE